MARAQFSLVLQNAEIRLSTDVRVTFTTDTDDPPGSPQFLLPPPPPDVRVTFTTDTDDPPYSSQFLLVRPT